MCSTNLNIDILRHVRNLCILFIGIFTVKLWCVKLGIICSHPLAFIDNLYHLCKHLDFREDETDVKTVLGTLLNLMEDPDKDVRVAFSGNIKHILESLDSEDGFIKEVDSFYFLNICIFVNLTLKNSLTS